MKEQKENLTRCYHAAILDVHTASASLIRAMEHCGTTGQAAEAAGVDVDHNPESRAIVGAVLRKSAGLLREAAARMPGLKELLLCALADPAMVPGEQVAAGESNGQQSGEQVKWPLAPMTVATE